MKKISQSLIVLSVLALAGSVQATPGPAPVAPAQATQAPAPAPFQETPELGQTTIYRGVSIVLTKRAKKAYQYVRRNAPSTSRMVPTEEYEKIYARQKELKKENP